METIGGAPPVPTTAIAASATRVIIIAAVLQVFSTAAVVFRFLSRRLVRAVGWDDWASLAALLLSYSHTAAVVICATVGRLGYHLAGFTYVQEGEAIKDVMIWNVTLVFSTTCSKIALLWLLRRLFPVESMRIRVWIAIAVVLGAYWLIGCCLLIFPNIPIDSQWKPWVTPRRKLRTKSVFEYVVIADMVTDIGILCLPQVSVWKLQIPLRRRLMISALFLLGAFTCATTVIRLYYVVKLDEDFTYHEVRAGLWGTIEANLSIIVGCVPVFPKLLRYWRTGRQASSLKQDAVDADFSKASSPCHNSVSPDGGSPRASQSFSVHSTEDKSTTPGLVDLEIDHDENLAQDIEDELNRKYPWISFT